MQRNSCKSYIWAITPCTGDIFSALLKGLFSGFRRLHLARQASAKGCSANPAPKDCTHLPPVFFYGNPHQIFCSMAIAGLVLVLQPVTLLSGHSVLPSRLSCLGLDMGRECSGLIRLLCWLCPGVGGWRQWAIRPQSTVTIPARCQGWLEDLLRVPHIMAEYPVKGETATHPTTMHPFSQRGSRMCGA